MSISIGIDGDTYVLKGNISRIKDIRRAKSNFKSIDANFEEDRVIVPFSTESNPTEYDNKENQYEAIKRIFDKFNIEYSRTESAKNFLAEIDEENKNFEEFSLKAKNIRNDKHTGDEFQDFTNILKSELKRELYPLQLLSAYHLAFAQNACNFFSTRCW